MEDMPFKLKVYVTIIILLGLFCLFLGIYDVTLDKIPIIIIFIIIGAVSESLSIQINKNFAISMNSAIDIANIMIFKSYFVVIIGFFSTLVYLDSYNGKLYHLFNTSLYKRIFNSSTYTISLLIGTYFYTHISYTIPIIHLLDFNILSILFSIISYIFSNFLIYLLLMNFLQNKNIISLLKEDSWLVINLIATSPIGILIAIIYQYYGFTAILLFLGPLLLANFTFRLYTNLRKVYLKTINNLSNQLDSDLNLSHNNQVAEYESKVAQELNIPKNF